ncbi:replication initiation and membrane attachment family protein [Bacillus sp. 03113]|uniref:replication initiation and membrane attachment family protein n=1 Tax=Bacillus sp. 03113 TaxID=2578211 RepID=UPI0011447B4B|nr:replication initiation and membrane attachment family protein [Bacillus sp. 03113]
MVQHWQELLPVDRYAVAANGLLHEYDRKVLTFLYQPLIGPVCLSLYMTFWAEIEENRLWSQSNTHHSLMNFMNMNLSDIYDARVKLEGIGLMRSYMKKEEENRLFLYEINPPLTPEQFFLDGMLNIFLYRKIGKNQYVRLKRFFSDQKTPPTNDFKTITKSFQDVFMSISPSALTANKDEEEGLYKEDGNVYIGRNETAGIKIIQSDFDFDLLKTGLNNSLVPKKAFTAKVNEAIQNLAFLYGIDAIQMKNLVLNALNEDDEIDIEELRKAARDWYQFEHQDELPTLVDRIQPRMHQTQVQEPKTKEEKLIHYLENTSPRQLLTDISGGAKPSKSDLLIIEDVMFQQKLLPGVINVLIQYVMLRTDMKLSKGYVEKIASHWVRKKIKTAEEAMSLAKKEHQQYLDWANGKNKNVRNKSKNKSIRTEMLPEWFKENQDSSEAETINHSKTDDYEKKKLELEEKLKKYRS